MKPLQIKGQKYGRLTAIRRVGSTETKRALWLFRCDCGNEIEREARIVKNGGIRSCGCLNTERISSFKTKYSSEIHGECETRLYRIWAGMKARCNCKTATNHKYYEDVNVCEEWVKYTHFRDWALKNGYRDDLSIDRINPYGDYEPSNCRWSDSITQANNKRKSPQRIKKRGITL